MNSKQQFSAVCAHKYPDCIPIDYLANVDMHKKIMMHYGLETERELLDLLFRAAREYRIS